MKIKDLSKLSKGTDVEFDALMCDIKELTTKANKPYLQVSVQDNTGTLEFPVWDNVEHYKVVLKTNNVYQIEGNIGFYEDKVQIQGPVIIHVIDDIDYKCFVPSYDIPKECIEYFENTVNNMNQKYKSLAMAATGCLGYDKKLWKEFTTCVSAQKHHGNKLGGLFLHTTGVLKAVDSVIDHYIENPYFYDAKDVIDKDRLRFKAIIHDIAKMQEYEYNGIIRYKPNKLKDHTVDGIIVLNSINEQLGNVLTEDEIEDISYSILSHHGQWGKFEPKSLEDWLLHIADLTDARVVGAVEGSR